MSNNSISDNHASSISAMEQNLQNLLKEKFSNEIESRSTLEGGKRRKSKKSSRKGSKKGSKKASAELDGGKRRRSKKASKKGSKKVGGGYDEQEIEGGRRRKGSKKGSKGSKKSSRKASRAPNPYMIARIALVKALFAYAKSHNVKLLIPESAKIINKLSAEAASKYNISETDKIEIIKKALDVFKANSDKYVK